MDKKIIEKINDLNQSIFDGFLDVILESKVAVNEYELGRLIGDFVIKCYKYEGEEANP